MEMFYKKENCKVTIYKFFEDKTVLIFSPHIASKQNGNGWEKIKISQLIPMEYFDEYKGNFMSKTERNKIKERLVLTKAEWTCTDGVSYSNCDEAIKHEQEVMNNVKCS